jgi:hypothetical protein
LWNQNGKKMTGERRMMTQIHELILSQLLTSDFRSMSNVDNPEENCLAIKESHRTSICFWRLKDGFILAQKNKFES